MILITGSSGKHTFWKYGPDDTENPGVEGSTILKFAFEISKKMLSAASTFTLANPVTTFGMTMV